MMSKKGIGGLMIVILIVVFVIVVIIALVITTVVISWSSIRPSVNSASQQVSTQSACFSVQVKPVSCTSGGQVTVQLVSSEGIDVTGLVGVAKDANGNEEVGTAKWDSSVDKEGDMKTVNTGLTGVTSASAAATVLVNGKTVTCPQPAATVSCS